MKQASFTVISNAPLTAAVFRLTLSGDTSAITRPGQFVNIRLDGLYLRRPLSVCDASDGVLTLLYKVVGKGTGKLASLPAGTPLDLLTGLGNGYDTTLSGERPLLVGGGVGVPPLYLLAKTLLQEGKRPAVLLGFNTKSEIFYENEFRALGVPAAVTTVDGSYGKAGFVTAAMDDFAYTHVYTCGPEPMLKAVWKTCRTGGQFSFEERMGCGFGACMGCSCRTVTGYKRICKDGPVLMKEEILWNA